MLRFEGTSFLLVTGGGSTRDKPTVTFRPPMDPDIMTHELTIRVPRLGIRCFLRDPDGHLLEISEAKTR